MINRSQKFLIIVTVLVMAVQGVFQLLTYFDWKFLSVLWLVTLLAGILACLIFKRDFDQTDDSFLAMLKGRKAPLSLIIGLGMPLPIGMPAVLAPFYISGGFEGTPFLTFSFFCFVVLTILSYAIFFALCSIRSKRLKTKENQDSID